MRIGMFFMALCLAHASLADTKATTEDGKPIILKDNGTWHYVSDDSATAATAALQLEMRRDIPNGCKLGLRLTNELSAQIRTLVLRFTAYKAGDIPFETVSRGYTFIKPTTNQYQEIRFREVSCDAIDKVQVAAAHNCHVGQLTKYNADEGRCLELIRVEESSLMTLYKAPTEPAPKSAKGR